MRALVLSARVGGHWTAGQALVQELQATLPPDAQVDLVDIFATPYARWFFAFFAHLYEPCVRLAPILCALSFGLSNGQRRVKLVELFRRILFDREAVAALLEPRPDLIVSDAFNFGQLRLVRDLLRPAEPAGRFVVVITDPVTLHWAWWSDAADWYFVGTDVAAQHCIGTFGIKPEQVVVTGLPVRAAFAQPRCKVEVRRSLGLDEEAYTVLYMGGTAGAGGIDEYAGAVDAAGLKVQQLAITGLNAGLRQHLEQQLGHTGLRAYGYVENVHDFMQAADLVVTKAGPGTISEAIASRAPVCISGHLPWTERGNAEYFVKLGRAMCVETPDDLVLRLRDVIAGEDRVLGYVAQNNSEVPWGETFGAIGRAFTAVLRLNGGEAPEPALAASTRMHAVSETLSR